MTNMIQFPRRNKGRIRKSTGANSEGMLAMFQTGAAGPNVVIFNEHRADALDRSDYFAYVLAMVINKLPAETRRAARRSALADAALGESDIERIAGSIMAATFGRETHAD